MLLTGAQIIVECLLEQRVDVVFGYPGGAVLNLYDALYEYSDRITHIMTAHEQGAAHAADGYARASGRPGVVIATSGPGATNLVTGLATAYMDSSPVVAVTGNVSVPLLGRDSFQEVDITGITTPVTKHNFIVKDVAELADVMRRAFAIAQEGRKGPVLVDVPKDVTAAQCEFTRKRPAAIPEPPLPEHSLLSRAAALIQKSKRPLFYLGGGVIASGASGAAAELSRRAGIPAALSLMALGSLPADDPHNLGMIGMHGTYAANRAVSECDLLIAAGARFSDRVAGNRDSFARDAKIIQIDIDDAEFDKNVRVDLRLHGDLRAVLRELTALVPQADHADWLAHLDELRAPAASAAPDRAYPDAREVIETAARILPNAVVVTDVGQHQMWAAQYFPVSAPRRFLSSGGLGTMGFGMGAAIGASYALPNERILLFTGDGSFHMNLNEAVTLASYGLPVTVVVMNNRVLGMVRQWQKVFYGRRFSSTDPHRATDYVKLAEAFGVRGLRIETPEQIEPVLREALTADGPVIVDCRISPDQNVLPMIPPGGGVEDIIQEME